MSNFNLYLHFYIRRFIDYIVALKYNTFIETYAKKPQDRQKDFLRFTFLKYLLNKRYCTKRFKEVVVAELKVVLKLITLGVKFQECAAHSNKSNNSKLTLERNLLIVLTAKK